MIDTIKLGIPLTQHQFKKLYNLTLLDENWQWVRFQPITGELKLTRFRGLAVMDRESFHREVSWDIPDRYREGETYLTLEFSLPKYWYGHNILLLYDFRRALEEIKKILEKSLNCRFVNLLDWQIWRLDLCYGWRCPSQLLAQQVLDSLKHLNYPRKSPIIYPTSILFAGTTYSLKFYLKLPEFINHDRKTLLEQKANLEWIEYLEKLADGILRVEATLRRKYLKRIGLITLKDLFNPQSNILPDKELVKNYPRVKIDKLEFLGLIFIINAYNDFKTEVKIEDSNLQLPVATTLKGLSAPTVKGKMEFNLSGELIVKEVNFKGGGYYCKSNEPTFLLNFFIDKFLGDYKGMNKVEQVEIILRENYKPSIATRLIGFWLYLQRFGTVKTKEMFGRDSYYRYKRNLQAVGISLLESSNIIDASSKFGKEFSVEIPSSYTCNPVDEFRDHSNLLNLILPDKLVENS